MSRALDGSWLDGYLRYTDMQESPELFHFWTGACVISGVLDRRVYIDYGFFKKFPNLFVILVAGSQKCRKSTAIDMGMDIIEGTDDVVEGLEEPPLILSQKMTPQALISALSNRAEETGRASGMIVADEISTYLDKNSIQLGMLPVLLKLHDCKDPFEYRTKDRGKEELPKSYATFLAGSAPEYLRTSLPSDEAGGGMLARTILVYQDTPREPRPFLELDDVHMDLRKNLVDDLEQIARLEGTFELTAKARKWYENWYVKKWHTGKESMNRDDSLRHYLNKKPDHLQALAQIISVAEDNRLLIKQSHFVKALNILKSTEQYMHKPLSNIVAEGQGVRIKQVRDAIALIFSYGKRPSYKRILRSVYQVMGYEEMRESVNTLLQAGLIERHRSDDGETYFTPNEDRDIEEYE